MRVAPRPPWVDDRMQYFVRADERENKAAVDGKRIEPNRGRVVRARVYEDRIGGSGIERASIAVDHLDVRKMGEIASSTRSKLGVDLEGSHVAAATDHVREDRRVVSGAASDMHDSFVAFEVERVEPHCQTARLSIVQKSFRQDAYQHIVIEIAGMRFAWDAIAFLRKEFPRWWPEVTLTRRFGKGADQQLRAQMRNAPNFSSVASARAIQILHGSGIV